MRSRFTNSSGSAPSPFTGAHSARRPSARSKLRTVVIATA
jgi:hypothetical protein